MQKLNIISISITILFYLFTITHASYAETSSSTSRINAETDVYVEQNKPYKNFEGSFHNYAGYTNSNGSIVSYLKFDISQIPKSDLMHDIIIDSAQLSLLVQSVNGSADKFFVTVSYCSNNTWTAEKVTWNRRICSDNHSLKGVDSAIVNLYSLPNIFKWDVLGGIVNAIQADTSKITFAVTSFPLSIKPSGYPPISGMALTQQEASGFVTFWSSKKAGYGFSAAPALVISYTVKDSSFSTSLNFMLSTVLPTLSIVVPAILWIYRKTKQLRNI